jgi:hypothetical protein
VAFKSYLRVKKVDIHVFLSIHNTFKHKRSYKCVNFSSLGSGPKRPYPAQDPDPTKKRLDPTGSGSTILGLLMLTLGKGHLYSVA